MNHIIDYNFPFYRDEKGSESSYQPLAIIEHRGQMTEKGEGQGHYICDIKSKEDKLWYRTNDNQNPVQISINNVTNHPVVVLFQKLINR